MKDLPRPLNTGSNLITTEPRSPISTNKLLISDSQMHALVSMDIVDLNRLTWEATVYADNGIEAVVINPMFIEMACYIQLMTYMRDPNWMRNELTNATAILKVTGNKHPSRIEACVYMQNCGVVHVKRPITAFAKALYMS